MGTNTRWRASIIRFRISGPVQETVDLLRHALLLSGLLGIGNPHARLSVGLSKVRPTLDIDAGDLGMGWAVQGEVAMLAVRLVTRRPQQSATGHGIAP